MCRAFSGFLFPIYSCHSVALFKNGFPLNQDSFGSSYGFVLGETQILANLRSSWDSHHVGFL